MTEALWVAIIAAIPGTIGAILASRASRHALRARRQVENNHSTNLREEADDRHAENTSRLEQLAAQVDAGFTHMHNEFRALWGKAGSNAERIQALEETDPNRRWQAPRGRHTRREPL